VTSVASAPNGGDIRAHTRPRDNVYLDPIFFEDLKHANMSEAACRARGENKPNLATTHLAAQAPKMASKLSRIAVPQVAVNRALERLLDIAAQAVSLLQALQIDNGLDSNALVLTRVRFAAKQIQFKEAPFVLSKHWIDRAAATEDFHERFDREFLRRLDDYMPKLALGTIEHACERSSEGIMTRPVDSLNKNVWDV
jgi:hypothetical protein